MAQIKTKLENVGKVLDALFGIGSRARESWDEYLAEGDVEGTLDDFCEWTIGHTNEDGSFSVNAGKPGERFEGKDVNADVEAGRAAA